jgi:hypothetical protein
VFDKLPKYHAIILLRDFDVKIGKEDIFRPTFGNESLQEISKNNGLRVVYFATSKNLTVKRKIFPHYKIYKFTWITPDGKTHTKIDHILIERRWHSSILDV